MPNDLDFDVVVENVSTHKTPWLPRWLLRHPWGHRGALVRRAHQQLVGTVNPPIDQRAKAVENEWIERWNDNPVPFVWHKTAEEILDSLDSVRESAGSRR